MKADLDVPSQEFRSLTELLLDKNASHPDRTVFRFLPEGEEEGESWTYRELTHRSQIIGRYLMQKGLQGERALLLYPPGLEYIAAFFGCLFGGLIAVPAYPPDPNRLTRTLPRLQAIVRDSQAKIVLTIGMIDSMKDFIFYQAPDLAKLEWIATDHLPDDGAKIATLTEASPKSLAFLQYTSGSTGEPKGVTLSHQNILHNLKLVAQGFEVRAGQSAVCWLPPYHDMGLIGGILGTIFCSMTSTLMSPLNFLQKPLRWLKAISRYGADVSGGPNFAFELCLRKVTPEQRDQLNLGSWKLAFTGAEPIRAETLKHFVEFFGPCGFQAESFYPCYGLAEGTLIVTGGKRGTLPRQKHLVRKDLVQREIVESQEPGDQAVTLVSCGTGFADQTLKIVAPDSLTSLGQGEIGEIWVRGPSIAQGYWNQEARSHEIFGACITNEEKVPFMRTGDLGFLSEGELFLTGRLKDLIIIRGQNHYPEDIERTVESLHPLFRPGGTVAFSIDKDFEERLVVVQEVERVEEGMTEAILKAVSEKHELQVAAVVLVAKGKIPKTSSGKVRRQACREEYLSEELEGLKVHKSPELSGARGPISPAETSRRTFEVIRDWLIQNLSERLGISSQEIDIQKPLTQYGLDSKEAVNLSGELEDWLGSSFSPTILWKYPNIESLARHLAGEGK